MKPQMTGLTLVALFLMILACELPVTINVAPTPDVIGTSVAQAQTVAARLTGTAIAMRPVDTPTVFVPNMVPITREIKIPTPTVYVPPTLLPTITVYVPPPPPPSPTLYVPPPVTASPTKPPPFSSLINHHTQMCLTITNSGVVVQTNCIGNANQLWQVNADYGSLKISSMNGGCLGVSDIDIAQATCSSSPTWTLVPFGSYADILAKALPHPPLPHPHPAVLDYGTYFQISAGGKCADVDGWNHNVGGRIILEDCRSSDNANQLWARYP